MRKIKGPQAEQLTQGTVFEKGKERKLIIALDATRLYIRAQGFKTWHVLNYGAAYVHAAAAEAGFDPSPRGKKGARS